MAKAPVIGAADQMPPDRPMKLAVAVGARSLSAGRWADSMTIVRRLWNRCPCLGLSLLSLLAASDIYAAGRGDLSHFLGTWHGTSTCVNRQVAPACKDETVVYEVGRSDKPQTAVLKAYKIVDGKRVPMGELEFVYSEKEGCWRAEFTTSRVQGVWHLVVDGRHMTGGLRVLPEKAEVRKVELKHE